MADKQKQSIGQVLLHGLRQKLADDKQAQQVASALTAPPPLVFAPRETPLESRQRRDFEQGRQVVSSADAGRSAARYLALEKQHRRERLGRAALPSAADMDDYRKAMQDAQYEEMRRRRGW